MASPLLVTRSRYFACAGIWFGGASWLQLFCHHIPRLVKPSLRWFLSVSFWVRPQRRGISVAGSSDLVPWGRGPGAVACLSCDRLLLQKGLMIRKMEKENMRNTRGYEVHFQWVLVPCLLCLSVKFEMDNVTGWVTQVKSSEAGFRKIGAKQDDELIRSERETESMQERDRTRR